MNVVDEKGDLVSVMRRLTAVGFVAILICGLMACQGNQPADDGAFVAWTKINQEYRDTVTSFPYPLPEGVQFPKDAPRDGQESQLYERGWGAMQAYIFAECAYQGVVVTHESTDMVTALAALDMAQEIHGLPEYQKHFADPDGLWQDVVDKAKLGDFSVFNQFYETDCGG